MAGLAPSLLMLSEIIAGGFGASAEFRPDSSLSRSEDVGARSTG
jgi:hypothetical protein